MRVMYDSVNPVGCPPDGQLYAGYVDGDYEASYAGMVTRFPGKLHVSITVHPTGNAVMADVEKGDLTPADAAEWVKLRRNLGHEYPVVYCSLSNVPAVLAECRTRGVTLPVYFAVAHTGQGPTFDPAPAGAIFLSKQYEQNVPYDGSSYDKSSVVDYWPGVDPAPKPKPVPPVPEEDELMPSQIIYSIEPGPDGVAIGAWCREPNSGMYYHVDAKDKGANNITTLVKGGAVEAGAATYQQHQDWLKASVNNAPTGDGS